MKKNILIATLMFISVTAAAQTNAEFLTRFDRLLGSMKESLAQNKDSVHAWKMEYKEIQFQYKNKYKKEFSDDELERYSKMNGQYRSKMVNMKLDKLSSKADTVGTKIGRSVQRTGKKIGGFFNGLAEKSNENRKK